MVALHPDSSLLAPELNLNVRHPDASVEVIGDGNTFPFKVPAIGEATDGPLKTDSTSLSSRNSVLNVVKVTLVLNDGPEGHIVVTEFSLGK